VRAPVVRFSLNLVYGNHIQREGYPHEPQLHGNVFSSKFFMLHKIDAGEDIPSLMSLSYWVSRYYATMHRLAFLFVEQCSQAFPSSTPQI